MLRKIGKPVPMYARYSADQLPEFGKRIGYDLAVADWVSPYGTGNHADLYFEGLCDLRADADYDCSLRVSFLSPFDGIQLVKEDRRSGSAFHLPRFAPEDGYQSELVLSGSSRPLRSYDRGCKEDDNYILRTRSVVVDEVSSGYVCQNPWRDLYFSGSVEDALHCHDLLPQPGLHPQPRV